MAAAVCREVQEETGYEVEVVRLVGVYSDPAENVLAYPDGNVVQYVQCLFECRVIGGAPRRCEESTDLGWFAPDDLPTPFVPIHRHRLADALTHQTAAFYR